MFQQNKAKGTIFGVKACDTNSGLESSYHNTISGWFDQPGRYHWQVARWSRHEQEALTISIFEHDEILAVANVGHDVRVVPYQPQRQFLGSHHTTLSLSEKQFPC